MQIIEDKNTIKSLDFVRNESGLGQKVRNGKLVGDELFPWFEDDVAVCFNDGSWWTGMFGDIALDEMGNKIAYVVTFQELEQLADAIAITKKSLVN